MYGFTPSLIALTFAVPAIMYAIATPFVFKVTNALPGRLAIMIGMILMALSQFILGQPEISEEFGFENK